MIDVELQQRLTVLTDGTAGPYIMVPVRQLPAVEAALRGGRVAFSVTRDAIQLDGHDSVAVVDFGRQADVTRIQNILDQHD